MRGQNGFRGLLGRFLAPGFASRLLEGWEQLLFIPDAHAIDECLLADDPEVEGAFDALA